MSVPLNLEKYRAQTVEEIALALAAEKPEPRSPYGLLVHAIDHQQARGYETWTNRLLSRALACVSSEMDLKYALDELQRSCVVHPESF